MSKKIAMIPARMGSQRLKKKNLRELNGVPLIVRAIRKCKIAACFDEIWVNSEDVEFGVVAEREGVKFHQRPLELGGDSATSEQFVREFLLHRECDSIFQVHSVAPLLTSEDVSKFVEAFMSSSCDVMLSAVLDQIEVAFRGLPVNFTLSQKTNSQELTPVQRITWSITGWRRDRYLEAFDKNACATYYGNVEIFPVSPMAGHVIKTELDLSIAQAYLQALGDE